MPVPARQPQAPPPSDLFLEQHEAASLKGQTMLTTGKTLQILDATKLTEADRAALRRDGFVV